MTARPDFSTFHAAPKCDTALLALPAVVPTRRTRAQVRWVEFASLAGLAVLAVWVLILTDRVNGLERQAELTRIVGSEEAIELQAADRVRAAGMQ